jgi:acetyl-CoA carboxylase biotin carboxyl carrier protein
MSEDYAAAAPHGFLDDAVLRRLFRDLQGTDIDELEIEIGDARLYLRREPGGGIAGQRTPGTTREDAPGEAIVAPLTGVFYARPSPEEPAFVSPGEVIAAGHVVGLIETMKLFNEVMADVAGEILEVVAQDGDLVEVGQPLVYVRRTDGEEEI